MTLVSVVLWLHALCGVIWVGTCASFALAAAALSTETAQWREFALRTAPRINRIAMAIAGMIPLTGIANLGFAAAARGFALPAQFVAVLICKVALYAAMALLLWAAWGAESALRSGSTNENAVDDGATAQIRKLMTLYGVMAALGTLALGLGLWLSGS
jgi:hypothetical protein